MISRIAMLVSTMDLELMQNFRIDIATAGDITSIATMWIEANNARLDRRASENAADIQYVLHQRMSERDASFFLGFDAEHIVGIGHQLPAREDDGASPKHIVGLMHLSMIAVEPARWGEGIGKAITARCIAHATNLGYGSIQLWTHASNNRAQRLYASFGFEPTGRAKFDDGEYISLYRRALVR